MSKEPKFAYHRTLMLYISMSGIPKIIARIELNLPLCLLMICFEILMSVLISLMSGHEENSHKSVYAWLVFLDGIM
jgi:hypothetical protein